MIKNSLPTGVYVCQVHDVAIMHQRETQNAQGCAGLTIHLVVAHGEHEGRCIDQRYISFSSYSALHAERVFKIFKVLFPTTPKDVTLSINDLYKARIHVDFISGSTVHVWQKI